MAKKSRFFRRHRKKWSKIKNILDFSYFHIYLFRRKSAPLNNFYRAALPLPPFILPLVEGRNRREGGELKNWEGGIPYKLKYLQKN